MRKIPVGKIVIALIILAVVFVYCVWSDIRVLFVITGSMEPVIPARSLIMSEEIATGDITEGKVIAYYDNYYKRITAHRIVADQNGGYVTKGDSNDFEDRYLVRSEDVIGEVVAVLPIMSLYNAFVPLALMVGAYIFGVLLKRFLLFLKHGNSCPFPPRPPFRGVSSDRRS